MNIQGVLLTLISLLFILVSILVHVWPAETLCHCLVRQRPPFSMTLTNYFMQLVQETIHLLEVET